MLEKLSAHVLHALVFVRWREAGKDNKVHCLRILYQPCDIKQIVDCMKHVLVILWWMLTEWAVMTRAGQIQKCQEKKIQDFQQTHKNVSFMIRQGDIASYKYLFFSDKLHKADVFDQVACICAVNLWKLIFDDTCFLRCMLCKTLKEILKLIQNRNRKRKQKQKM